MVMTYPGRKVVTTNMLGLARVALAIGLVLV